MTIDRRTLLGAATATIPLISVGIGKADTPDFSAIRTVGQFANQVIGRADLSRSASEIAVKKAARGDAKEFAGFELEEAKTVISVLTGLGIVVPVMGPEAKSALAHIADSRAGADFDKAYMTAQFENHAYLRDLAAAYLKNADKSTADPDEKYGQRLATVAHWAFWEHTEITRRICRELEA